MINDRMNGVLKLKRHGRQVSLQSNHGGGEIHIHENISNFDGRRSGKRRRQRAKAKNGKKGNRRRAVHMKKATI